MTFHVSTHCPHCAEPVSVWLEAEGPVYYGLAGEWEKICPCWWTEQDFSFAEESAKRNLDDGDFDQWR